MIWTIVKVTYFAAGVGACYLLYCLYQVGCSVNGC